MNRVVRRCFLLSDDPITGKNYDHRKLWIEDLLQRSAAHFGIDLLGFAILSNHFHLILRSRPDVVATWNDTEVARRWLMLCPVRKTDDRQPEEPNDVELNSLRNDPDKLAKIRLRLSDIGWWMRLLCQQIAVRANHEDQEVGKFWQSRFRAVRLLDEAALLACAAYVDLNPIRAGMAKTLETSDFTSVQRRTEAARGLPVESRELKKPDKPAADNFLAPLTISERADAKLGPAVSKNGSRASDKGFLPLSVPDYLALLDWTARQIARSKRGWTPQPAPPVVQRLGFEPRAWCELAQNFGRLFRTAAGRPQTIDATRSRAHQHRFNLGRSARQLLSASN